MSVTREQHAKFEQHGEVRAAQLNRRADGGWSVDLVIDLRYVLPDGREVIVRKDLTVTASFARRPKRELAMLDRAARVAGTWPMSGPRK